MSSPEAVISDQWTTDVQMENKKNWGGIVGDTPVHTDTHTSSKMRVPPTTEKQSTVCRLWRRLQLLMMMLLLQPLAATCSHYCFYAGHLLLKVVVVKKYAQIKMLPAKKKTNPETAKKDHK